MLHCVDQLVCHASGLEVYSWAYLHIFAENS